MTPAARHAAAVAATAALLALPATASARIVRWGSGLTARPTQTIPGTYAADAEFWNTALGSARAAGVNPAVAAPTSGRILQVKLKTGSDSRAVPLRFTVVHPLGGGRFKVLTTSTPSLKLPAHSPGVHTFSMRRLRYKMPINKGDYLAIATPGVKPAAMLWYGAVPGAAVNLFTSRGATQNPGHVWNGSVRPGLELLMQVVERPGPSYHFYLPR